MGFLKIFLSILFVFTASLAALPETAVEMGTRLAKMNDDRPVFERVKARINLIINNSSGEVRFTKVLIMAAYTENMNSPVNYCERYITYFMAPADDQGNAYLSYHYKNQSDVKWAYLKGIRRAKKVTGADKKLSFFGSDFTNGEMGKPNFLEWKYKYLGDDKVTFRGNVFDCYMIESLPKTQSIMNENGCGRRVSYVEKKTLLTLRLDYYDENLTKIKEMRLVSFTTKNNINGQKVYYETGLEMRNLKTGTRTELRFSDVKVESEANIRTDIFTEQYLIQKWW
ncbi:MAG: hypothetical protein A2W19_07690 [Spirochaetes bacterium RBG_16_49_21]|nr:MAG: hypothetical protein A2W19_07690 [Spirochaetes bacterium RBG_16_49_21]